MKDKSPFVFAGLWDGWKDPANDEWLHTCTIITGEQNDFVREIHPRMPEEHHDTWLSGEAGKEVLVPYPADRMKVSPISSRVNSLKKNDADIIASIELESVLQQLIYQGKDKTRTWTVAEIDDLSHRFENSSIALRDLMKEIWNI